MHHQGTAARSSISSAVFCSVAFGHNHPRDHRRHSGRKFQAENRRHEISHGVHGRTCRPALAHNLAQIAPGDRDGMVFLGSTGSEAMEAALKVAEQAQGPGRSEDPARGKLLPRQDQGRALGHRLQPLPVAVRARRQPGLARPSAISRRVRLALESDPAIGIVVMETIQGGGGIAEAPLGFWRELRAPATSMARSGRRRGPVRLGRTGQFFAFERDGVVPDVDRGSPRRSASSGRGRRDDRPPRDLHEGRRRAEGGADPRPGHVRRHGRGLHQRDRGAQRASMRKTSWAMRSARAII